MTRPILFLDVDGVLNAVSRTAPEHPTWPDWRRDEVNGYLVWTSWEMGQRLKRLPVDIYWATTWGHLANEHIAPLVGLPNDLPVATDRDKMSDCDDGHWKGNQVIDIIEREKRPFIWVDDDMEWFLALYAGEPDRGYPRASRSIPRDIEHLLVQPRTHEGLTPEALADIEGWLS